MTDGYYRLTINSNTLIFIGETGGETLNREIWDMPLPYVRDSIIYDMVSVSDEITINATIKTGSGRPYATPKAARTAIIALLPDAEITSCTLESGTWNGSAFSADSGTEFWNLPDSGKDLLVKNISPRTDVSDLNVVKVSIVLTQGGQL